MSNIAIVTDTGADNLEKYTHIDYIPLYITFDGNNYLKQSKDVSIKEFYEKLKTNDKFPKTSLPAVMDFVDCFNKHLDEGKEVLYIALDSKFSGTYQASLTARDLVLEERPDAKITIIDSLNCTFMQCELACRAYDMAEEGKSVEEIVEVLNKMIPTSRVYCTVDSLENIKESGRVSNMAAAVGGLLNIKPILKFEDGVLGPDSKVKGLSKAYKTCITNMKEYLDGQNLDDWELSVVYGGDNLEGAKEFAEMLQEEIPVSHLDFCNLGVCIGLHGGPTLMGVCALKERNL